MLDFRKSSIIGALRKVLIRFYYPLEVMLVGIDYSQRYVDVDSDILEEMFVNAIYGAKGCI